LTANILMYGRGFLNSSEAPDLPDQISAESLPGAADKHQLVRKFSHQISQPDANQKLNAQILPAAPTPTGNSQLIGVGQSESKLKTAASSTVISDSSKSGSDDSLSAEKIFSEKRNNSQSPEIKLATQAASGISNTLTNPENRSNPVKSAQTSNSTSGQTQVSHGLELNELAGYLKHRTDGLSQFAPLSQEGRIVLKQSDKVLLVGDSMMQG